LIVIFGLEFFTSVHFVTKGGKSERFGEGGDDNNCYLVGFGHDLDESWFFAKCLAELVGVDNR